ncbi:MAG: pyridoxamine 5'-phosphate oxidase family protein [Deltaproteobacteria bacterium]|nr:pyridoxamine 5'-phosphate oxidase family protein [Deltaproteobacteria bacterium]
MASSVADHIVGKRCLLASADRLGFPHLAAASVEAAEKLRVAVTGWFCPQTLANLEDNPRVCVVVAKAAEGYQLVGQVEERTVLAILDGYCPAEIDVPQTKFRLTIRVEKTMRLTDRAHSDEGIQE